jgi:hypothetical protein
MVVYKAIHRFLTEKNFHSFTFYTKADKTVKTDIRHLSGNISAENISVAFQEISYDVISVKQMTVKVPLQMEGSHTPPSRSS